jgi:hypothetical protein
MCQARTVVELSDRPSDFYISGDEAFICSAHVHFLSIVKGILWHPLQFEFSCYTKVLMVSAKLITFISLGRCSIWNSSQ